MTASRTVLAAASLMICAASAHAVDATTEANAAAVNAACEADASATGCTGKTVGTGLLKCLADYKKAHPEFTFSQGCKAATAKGVSDYKASQPPAGP